MATRLLLLIDQLPQDPTSGAARSLRTVCEMLAASGHFHVAALGLTATEQAAAIPARALLRAQGLRAATERRAVSKGDRPVLGFTARGVTYTLLDTGGQCGFAWEDAQGRQFDRLFDRALATFRPDIVLTYGGHPAMVARWRRARKAGAAVVFGLRNLGYLGERALFNSVDDVLTPSRFLSDRYRAVLGIESTALPLPIDLADTVAPLREPLFLTFVNPTAEKGVFFVARLAEELSCRRPDVPLLVIESRGTVGGLVAAGLAGGFDLRRHANIMVSPGVARPRDIFAATRVLLVPSVWEEPAGRVVPEALLNGVPPVVSDRGGLAEQCGEGGIVLALPPELTPETRQPVESAAVEPWIDAILPLMDDDTRYAEASRRAAAAAERFRPEQLAPAYVRHFAALHRGAASHTGATPGLF